MSDASEVKRWLVTEEDHGHVIPIEQVTEWHRKTWYKAVEVMPVEDHDRIVAELKAEALRVELVAEAAMEVIKEKYSIIARQARVIEKLKLAITDIANKNTCWRLYEIDKYKSYEDAWEGVAGFAGMVLNELEAIEQGEGM